MLYGKAKVEYEPQQIRHARVQCPKCHHWFYPQEISTALRYGGLSDTFFCPLCKEEFEISDDDIEETSEMPKAVISKTTWVVED